MKRTVYKCSTCGSKNILKDAWVEWNKDEECFTIAHVFDGAYCEDCQGETSVVFVYDDDDEEDER